MQPFTKNIKKLRKQAKEESKEFECPCLIVKNTKGYYYLDLWTGNFNLESLNEFSAGDTVWEVWDDGELVNSKGWKISDKKEV